MLAQFPSCTFRIGALLLALCTPSQAHNIEIAAGIFCDTQKQMEQFVTLFDGDVEKAVKAGGRRYTGHASSR